MKRQIALLRGINVGGKNILPMAELIATFESLGFENIKTYIQSGNAIFECPATSVEKLAEKITAAVQKSHRIEVQTLVFSPEALERAVQNNPYGGRPGKSVHYYFCAHSPEDPDIDRLASLKTQDEEFHLNENIFYLHAPAGIGRSRLAAKIESLLKVPVTARNGNTVEKLVQMCKS